MTDGKLRVLIAADTIPGANAGLGYFLFTAISKLAAFNPSWHFTVVAMSSFRELANIQAPNLSVKYYDDSLMQKLSSKVLNKLGLSDFTAEGNHLLSRVMPTRWLKRKFGNVKEIYGQTGSIDVVWLPHYLVADRYRFTPLESFSKVEAPVLFTIHDIHAFYFPDDWGAQGLCNFWQGFVPFVRKCAAIVTHTQFHKNAIVEHLGVEPGKITVVPCPPLIDKEVLLREYDLEEMNGVLKQFGISSPFAFYPGSGSFSHKNHTRLIMAWAELKKKLGEKCPTLVCTAKGKMWPALKAIIDSLDMGDKIVFTGTVDTDSLVKLYRTCVFVVVPTLYEGGGSGPVAEGIISAKPVVCSKIPQIEEQLEAYGVNHDDSGIIFFSPDSVDSIAKSLELAIKDIDQLRIKIQSSQEILFNRISGIWDQWAKHYSLRLERLVDDN